MERNGAGKSEKSRDISLRKGIKKAEEDYSPDVRFFSFSLINSWGKSESVFVSGSYVKDMVVSVVWYCARLKGARFKR